MIFGGPKSGVMKLPPLGTVPDLAGFHAIVPFTGLFTGPL
jgi:hypothetical protein